MDRKDFMKNRTDKVSFCNYPLKRDVVPDRDYICVSEPVWEFLHSRYAGEEIKRFAITKNPACILDRSPFLPMVQICLVLRDESIRAPKLLVVPRKSKFSDMKTQIRDHFTLLRDINAHDDDFRLWRLAPDHHEMDFIDQYN